MVVADKRKRIVKLREIAMHRVAPDQHPESRHDVNIVGRLKQSIARRRGVDRHERRRIRHIAVVHRSRNPGRVGVFRLVRVLDRVKLSRVDIGVHVSKRDPAPRPNRIIRPIERIPRIVVLQHLPRRPFGSWEPDRVCPDNQAKPPDISGVHNRRPAATVNHEAGTVIDFAGVARRRHEVQGIPGELQPVVLRRIKPVVARTAPARSVNKDCIARLFPSRRCGCRLRNKEAVGRSGTRMVCDVGRKPRVGRVELARAVRERRV